MNPPETRTSSLYCVNRWSLQKACSLAKRGCSRRLMSKREADHVTRGSGDVDAARYEPEGKHAKGSSRSQEGDAQSLTQNAPGCGSTGTQRRQHQKQTFASHAQQRCQRPARSVRNTQTPYQSQSGIVMFFCSCARVRPVRQQGLSTSRIELPLSRRFSRKHVK